MSGEAAAANGRFARYFVTDRLRFKLSIDALVERIVVAARSGVNVIQLRERDLSDRELASLVRRVRLATAQTAVRILVNDRADIAVAAGACGVHLRADSPPAGRMRAICPPGFLVGRSVHSIGEVDAASRDGACDYLMLGTVFPSTGKAAGHPVAGLEVLRAACARSPVPIVAIGGMNEERAAEAMRAGAAGVAAVEWFMRLTPLPGVV